MSILAAADQPVPFELPLLLLAGGLALLVAWFAGVFRKGSVRGPRRVGPEETLGPLVSIFFLGIAMWILGQWWFVALRSSTAVHPAATQSTTAAVLPLSERIEADVFARVLAVAAMLLATAYLRRGGLVRIGISPGLLPGGVGRGVIAALIVLPLMAWMGIATQLLWNALHLGGDYVHEMLTMLGKEGDGRIRLLIVVSAAVMAPISEELVFRGCLQTLLAATFARSAQRPGEARILPPPEPQDPASDGSATLLEYAPLPLPTWPRWSAILITSALFAAVHPWWSAPPIFFLSICLGYAYERTGNLWTPIILHAVFNATEVALYLQLLAK